MIQRYTAVVCTELSGRKHVKTVDAASIKDAVALLERMGFRDVVNMMVERLDVVPTEAATD